MKNKILMILVLIVCISCGGNQGEETKSNEGLGSFGTRVGNPGNVMMNSIFPEELNENTPSQNLFDTTAFSGTNDQSARTTLSAWKLSARNADYTLNQMKILEIIDASFVESWKLAASPAPDETAKNIAIEDLLDIGGGLFSYSADFYKEKDTDFLRIDFKNNNGITEATYRFKLDNSGNAVKGLWIYVRSQDIETIHALAPPLVAFAFDISNPANPQFLLRTEYFDHKKKYSVVAHNHMACSSSVCVGEYIDIDTQAPERKFTHPLRFGWEGSKVCVVIVSYHGGTALLGKTYGFDSTTGVANEGCQLLAPPWGAAAYTTDLLPFREGDGVVSTTAIYSSNWDAISSSSIDLWLKGEGF